MSEATSDYSPEFLTAVGKANKDGKVLVLGPFDGKMKKYAGTQIHNAVYAAQQLDRNYVLLMMDSQGGDVSVIQQFVGAMQLLRPQPDFQFIGHVQTQAMSACFLLLQYCDWRVAYEGSHLLLHFGTIQLNDTATLLRSPNRTKQSMTYFRSYLNEGLELLRRRSGLSICRLTHLCKDDTSLTARQALQLGFLDEVIDALPAQSVRPAYQLKGDTTVPFVPGN